MTPRALLEQRRPNAAEASDAAAPLVSDDAELDEPQLMLADVLHTPLSASNARSTVADDEASRRMTSFFFFFFSRRDVQAVAVEKWSQRH